jgi:hypothetical protein
VLEEAQQTPFEPIITGDASWFCLSCPPDSAWQHFEMSFQKE